jgi:hypothetical protein
VLPSNGAASAPAPVATPAPEPGTQTSGPGSFVPSTGWKTAVMLVGLTSVLLL